MLVMEALMCAFVVKYQNMDYYIFVYNLIISPFAVCNFSIKEIHNLL